MIKIIQAIKAINPSAIINIKGNDLDTCEIEWLEGTSPISKADIQTKMDELQVEYDAQDYSRKREAEYPSVQDLVVALYDTDDKTAIDEKRAEIKLKYPKPGA